MMVMMRIRLNKAIGKKAPAMKLDRGSAASPWKQMDFSEWKHCFPTSANEKWCVAAAAGSSHVCVDRNQTDPVPLLRILLQPEAWPRLTEILLPSFSIWRPREKAARVGRKGRVCDALSQQKVFGMRRRDAAASNKLGKCRTAASQCINEGADSALEGARKIKPPHKPCATAAARTLPV